MSILRATVLTLLLAVPTCLALGPAIAAPNNGKYNKSAEAMRKELAEACSFYQDMLGLAEREADKRAGTKAAKKYAEEADSWWEAGERHGCSWAK